MNKDVIMNLYSTITSFENSDGEEVFETHSMELTLPASFFEKGDTQYIFYKEEDPENGSITQCRLEIAGKKMVISRKGAASSQMELDVGKTTTSHYHTPFGQLLLQVTTDALQIKQTETSYQLQASYALSTDDTLMSKHTLLVKLSEQ